MHEHAPGGKDVRKWSRGQKLPLDTASVGGAVLNEFVDHITIEHNRLLFSELLRVLRPNGLLLVKSPSRHNRFDDDEGHVTFFSPSEFRTFVESFGFHVIEQPYTPQPLLGIRAPDLERWVSSQSFSNPKTGRRESISLPKEGLVEVMNRGADAT